MTTGTISKAPPTCSVKMCKRMATHRVILYDVYDYMDDEPVFFEQDTTCPFICNKHLIENERQARGIRQPRGGVSYPYTNKHHAQGFTIYQPFEE